MYRALNPARDITLRTLYPDLAPEIFPLTVAHMSHFLGTTMSGFYGTYLCSTRGTLHSYNHGFSVTIPWHSSVLLLWHISLLNKGTHPSPCIGHICYNFFGTTLSHYSGTYLSSNNGTHPFPFISTSVTIPWHSSVPLLWHISFL